MHAILTLTITDHRAAGVVFRFGRTCRVMIGRSRDADIRLEDPAVSRHHAVLEIDPPLWQIRDLTFTTGRPGNPPYVNGEQVQLRNLHDGDVITLGTTHLRCGIEWSRNDEPRPDESRQEPNGGALQCSRCGRDLRVDPDSGGSDLADAARICRECLPEGDDAAGTPIGDYELRRLLGAGRMGKVYQAWHPRINALVALKLIRDLGSEALNRRFAREVRVLHRAAHPGIVQFIDSGLHEGNAFIVMECLNGVSPESETMREASSPNEVVALIAGVLDILKDVHARSLVHGDIRPRNIVIPGRERNAISSPHPKLREFGLARFYQRAGASANFTQSERIEALRFMAPERAGKDSRASVLSDLYSAGATLYYLLSGQLPFDFPAEEERLAIDCHKAAFRSPAEAARAFRRAERVLFPEDILRREEPVPLIRRNPAVPEQVAAVVDRAVSKNPEDRFPTAAEFQRALRGGRL